MATPRTKNLLPALALALCMSTGERPSECQPAIRRYFSIVRRTLGKTLGARRDFLNQCPTAKEDGYTR